MVAYLVLLFINYWRKNLISPYTSFVYLSHSSLKNLLSFLYYNITILQ